MHDAARSIPVSVAGSPPEDSAPKNSRLIAAGGILAAIGASSCCVLPFVLLSLGIGGAWIGSLTALAPYQPLFLAAAFAFLAMGFARAYRRPGCAEGQACARPIANRTARIGLWTAVAIVVVVVAFPFAAALFL